MSTEFQFTQLTMADGYSPSADQDVATKVYVDGVSGSAPAGAIVAFGGTSAPSGWLVCDGASYLRGSYTALFAAIGSAYGTVDGTHFNVPDLRGRFLRGRDGGAGNDPDRTSRTAMATGGNTGDNVGSVQLDALQGHDRDLAMAIGTDGVLISANANGSTKNGANTAFPGTTSNNSEIVTKDFITKGSYGTPRISSESRPVNAYVNFIIKT